MAREKEGRFFEKLLYFLLASNFSSSSLSSNLFFLFHLLPPSPQASPSTRRRKRLRDICLSSSNTTHRPSRTRAEKSFCRTSSWRAGWPPMRPRSVWEREKERRKEKRRERDHERKRRTKQMRRSFLDAAALPLFFLSFTPFFQQVSSNSKVTHSSFAVSIAGSTAERSLTPKWKFPTLPSTLSSAITCCDASCLGI